MPLVRLLPLLVLHQQAAAFSVAVPSCAPALAQGTLATGPQRCSAPTLQEAKHRHKMQEKREGCGGAPRAEQFQWAAAQRLRNAAARHQQEDKERASKRGLLQRERKGSKAAVAASSSSAGGRGFGAAPAIWRRLEQPGDASARVDVSEVEALLLMRSAVLRAGNYEAADELRGELAQLGVAVRDEEMMWRLTR
jgi:cysteinyl-tRNA synthetase